jgi:hypothetical protein
MNAPSLLSDHVYDWSDRSINEDIVGTAQTPAGPTARPTAAGCHLARLADRALQALRQTRVQMRRRPRPRPEVLPVSELSRRAAADGLRAAGRYCGDPRAGRQLSSGTGFAGRGLRHQPRIVTAPRGAVRAGGERNPRIAHRLDRYRRRGAAHGQHDRTVAGRGARCRDQRGGVR